VTLAMLLRLINCRRFIIIIIVIKSGTNQTELSISKAPTETTSPIYLSYIPRKHKNTIWQSYTADRTYSETTMILKTALNALKMTKKSPQAR